MGTNYYFVTKNKKLVREFFDGEYEIDDEPYFHYEIHLNKLSSGWKPLFQKHQTFKTFAELEAFFKKHSRSLKIRDEYMRFYTWDEYKEKVIDHSQYDPKPYKWVYDDKEVWMLTTSPGTKKTLHLETCDPEEAEIWTPFDHILMTETEQTAQKRFKAWDAYVSWMSPDRYSRDPDYNFDWTDGNFC